MVRSIVTVELPRDRYGNPLIVLPNGETATYTRASQVGDVLDEKAGITNWSERMIVAGIGASPELQTLVSLVDRDDTKALTALAKRAKSAAGAWTASDLGTALHSVTERLDTGRITIDDIGSAFRPVVESYRKALDRLGLTVVAAEELVVFDELRIAGTLDRLVRDRDGVVRVADLKTGRAIYPTSKSITCQVSAYANSVRYDLDGTRTPIDDLDTSTALIFHVPAIGGPCTVYEVDCVRGLELCRIAQDIRSIRKEKLIRPLAS